MQSEPQVITLESEMFLSKKITGSQFYLNDLENNKPNGICRLNGTDDEGILYIGETDKPLYKRMSSLQDSINSYSNHTQTRPKLRGHKVLSRNFFRIRKYVKIEDLFIKASSIIESPEKDESHLLELYASEFGELPPLNQQYGKYPEWDLF